MTTPLSRLESLAPDIRPAHSVEHADLLRSLGHQDIQPLNAGMEAAAYRMSGGLVGKVWMRRSFESVQLLDRFYDELGSSGLPFAVPEISRVELIDGYLVSVERLLPGSPISDDRRYNQRGGLECVGGVLASLAEVVPTPTSYALPLIDEVQSPWVGVNSFAEVLSTLIDRRMAKYENQLSVVVNDFDVVLGGVKHLLTQVDERPPSVIHGDLGQANLLVDADLRPTALIDFGFMSTVGDPAFDAATAACFIDLWSPDVDQKRALADAVFAEAREYKRWEVLLYRAAYALISSNAYSEDGADGWFGACVNILNDLEVQDVLRSR